MVRGREPCPSDIIPIPAHPDINLLPMDQLPVQKILSFTQPPTPVAAAYLSAICRAEGTQLDECLSPAELQTGSVVDLRRCINQCQLGKPLGPFGTTHLQETTRNNWESVLENRAHFPQWVLQHQDESHHKTLFRCLAKHTDNISYLDSRLVLRVDTVSELLEPDHPQVELFCDRIGRTQRWWMMNLGTRFFQPAT